MSPLGTQIDKGSVEHFLYAHAGEPKLKSVLNKYVLDICGSNEEIVIIDDPFAGCLRINNHLEFTTFTIYHAFPCSFIDEPGSPEAVPGRIPAGLIEEIWQQFQKEPSLAQRQKEPDLTINVEIDALDQSTVDLLLEASLEDFTTDAEILRGAGGRHKVLGSALSRLDIDGNLGEADALIFTNFLIEKGSNVRVIIKNRRLNAARLARLIRRMLDICSYTHQGLEGEKVARDQLEFMKERLAKLSEITHDVDSDKDQGALFADIAKQQQLIAERISNTRAILTRSVAYWRIVDDKLAEFNEHPIEGFTRVGPYVKGRFKHVADNCRMSILCQDNMGKQVDDVTDLLGTRIDINISRINNGINMMIMWLGGIGAAYSVTEIVFRGTEAESLRSVLDSVLSLRVLVFVVLAFSFGGLFNVVRVSAPQISSFWCNVRKIARGRAN